MQNEKISPTQINPIGRVTIWVTIKLFGSLSKFHSDKLIFSLIGGLPNLNFI